MEIITACVTGLVSIGALALSIYSVYQVKRKLIADAITLNRIEWIANVRSLLMEFIRIYRSNGTVKEDMEILLCNVKLYMNSHNSYYSNLFKIMQKCIDDDLYIQGNMDEFIKASQSVLNMTWVRMKLEAGITKEVENKLEVKVKEYFPDLTISK